MKLVIDWIWNGPWWAPLIGAIYAAAVIGILISPLHPFNVRIRKG
jgi:hypothetical protein